LSIFSISLKTEPSINQSNISNNINSNSSNNLKRESSSLSVPQKSATATLSSNNSSIICTGPSPSFTIPPTSHHHHHHNTNSNVNSNTLLPKYNQHHQQHHHQPQHNHHHHYNNHNHNTSSSSSSVIELSKNESLKTPIVSANKENIPVTGNTSNLTPQSSVLSNNALSDTGIIDNTEQGIESLANAKEKTPMCLVNELARFNKIQHQYRLISEQGPAHKKRFTVILKLGDEEYAAEGLSIKKAQHAAAKDAIMKTAYKHPPLKTNRQLKGVQSTLSGKGNSGNITPTVELNALAMKRGEPTVYTAVSSTMTPPTLGQYNQQQPLQHHQPQYNGRGNPFQRRYPNARGGGNLSNRYNNNYGNNGTEIFHVQLQVGARTFSGMGPTQQAARHDAAAR
jgi:hypothetical protein